MNTRLVPVLTPGEMSDAAQMDDDEFFAFLQFVCREREATRFHRDMATGPHDPIPYRLSARGRATR